MKVRLKHRAFIQKRGLFEPGVVDWPDDVPLPSTAEKLTAKEAKEAETEAAAEEPELPIALSEVNPITGKKK
jgi:hypothetical protein